MVIQWPFPQKGIAPPSKSNMMIWTTLSSHDRTMYVQYVSSEKTCRRRLQVLWLNVLSFTFYYNHNFGCWWWYSPSAFNSNEKRRRPNYSQSHLSILIQNEWQIDWKEFSYNSNIISTVYFKVLLSLISYLDPFLLDVQVQ